MKTRLLLTLLLAFSCYLLSSQVPQGFNYQAIARSSNGKEIVNTALKVRISVLTDTTGFFSSGSGTYVWEEEHNVTTNSFGLFSLIAGNPLATKVQGPVASFSAINWNVNPLFLGAKIYYQGSWLNMGTSKFGSVPYSNVTGTANSAMKLSPGNKINGINFDGSAPITLPASSLSGPFQKIAVTGAATSPDSALFEVKNKNGQTIFAVYPEAVNIYVPKGAKGTKGGFAIGGFESVKGTPQDYFRVTADSVRVYIDNNPPTGKGSTKGGFAIGGFDAAKGALPNYFMNVTGANAVNTVDSASQILWYPNKQAFLAGRISIISSDSVGTNSTSLGYKSRAIGNYSQAFGYKTTARGDYSTAIGKLSVAGSRAAGISTASNAFAFGNAAIATGNDSYALGSGASASGFRSFAFGSVGLDDSGNPTSTPTTASQAYAFAIGMGAQATQKGAMAIGIGALSSGYYSNSFGYYSISSAYYSTALGFRSAATNNYSGAFGYYAKADGIGSLALGNRAWAVSNYSTAVGDSAKTQADYASAFGRMAKAKAPSSVAVGYNAQTSASATDAGAFGKNSIANGPYSAALGSGTTTGVSASYSTAIGYGSTTAGSYATALGYNSQAAGDKSMALGSQYTYIIRRPLINRVTGQIIWLTSTVDKVNTATRAYSLAIGNGNTAQDGGTAIGSNNSAMALGAVALGHSNWADTSYSFAAGYGNYSYGFNAFALGDNVTAQSANSFVIGTYNTITGDKYNWIDTDPLFVIGNGESGATHDALRVNKNGGIYSYPTSAYYGIYQNPIDATFGVYSYNRSNTLTGSVYGILSYVNQTNTAATGNVYSGYFFGANAGSGTYQGFYADKRTGGAIDLAEYIYDSQNNTRPADVVVADPNRKESVIKSSKPYQSSVVGVISTKPHMTMGMELVTDEKTGEPLSGVSAARLALSGRVPVNVTGENGAIVPGDYLTSSSTPGSAMKWTLLDVNSATDFADLKRILAENEKRRNAIIGKAVESFNGSGTAKIMMLISLQ